MAAEYSLYIHIPYCVRKCPYCNFNSYPVGGHGSVPDEYIDALSRELDMYERILGRRSNRIKSIYFGGGTPSLLSECQLAKILESIYRICRIKNPSKIETSLEVNPGTADISKLSAFGSRGIHRFIIGAQSFKEKDLKRLGRIHSAKDSKEFLDEISKSKIENYGIDLIFGIPGQTFKDWLDNLKIAISYNPKHISAYNLTLEEDTSMIHTIKKEGWKLPSEEMQSKMFIEGARYLKGKGFRHYEISNYAKRGFESVHNIAYWQLGAYIGLGAGAHSFSPGDRKRYWNLADPTLYMKSLSRNNLPVKGEEILDRDAQILEEIFLSLRTSKGMKKTLLRHGIDNPKLHGFINNLEKIGKLQSTGKYLRLTEEGFCVSNEIINKFADFLVK